MVPAGVLFKKKLAFSEVLEVFRGDEVIKTMAPRNEGNATDSDGNVRLHSLLKWVHLLFSGLKWFNVKDVKVRTFLGLI